MLRDIWWWLTGRTAIEEMIQDRYERITDRLISVNEEIFKLRNELAVTFNDELSPKRKELSDELGRRMQAKLIAEDKARRHAEGRL